MAPGFCPEPNALLDSDVLPEMPLGALDMANVVQDLRRKVEGVALADVVAEFEDEAPARQLVVAELDEAQVDARAKAVQDARLKALEGEASSYAKRELDLAWREQNARARVSALRDESLKRTAEERAAAAAALDVKEAELGRLFSRAGEQLTKVVERQRGSLRERYGYLEAGDAVAGRRYAVNWDLVPRPIEIRCHSLRAVKDKLPKGTYVFLVSMQDRLAGRPLRWTKTRSYGGGGFGPKPAATRPFKHKGRYHDVDLYVQQSVFALCPSKGELRPANCLVSNGAKTTKGMWLPPRSRSSDQVSHEPRPPRETVEERW